MKTCIAAALSIALYSICAAAAADSASATTTVAAPQKTYAVMSLIGDAMSVVVARNSSVSHIDHNDIQTYNDPTGALDLPALRATAAAIKKVNPEAKPILLATDSAILHKQQGQLIDGEHLVDADGLVADLKKSGATDFILITKHRAPTNLNAEYDAVGSGTLYGLGFYINSYAKTQRGDSGEEGTGYLAPYAYFEISLIDIATLTVKNKVDVTDGYILSNARNDSQTERNPWNILDANEKMQRLSELIQSNIMKNVPGMIAPAPAATQASSQAVQDRRLG